MDGPMEHWTGLWADGPPWCHNGVMALGAPPECNFMHNGLSMDAGGGLSLPLFPFLC